jgi:Na+-translocating ferredoxin:NAD+ oxidoreductase subunit D
MKFSTPPAPHAHGRISVRFVMGAVLALLLPAAAADAYFFGFGVWINFLLAAASGLIFEALALRLRHQALAIYLSDGSTLVTAALLAFAMPPLAPWWLTVSAMAFAVLVAKHLYGGLGLNPFNPAMVGYAVLLVSFPAQMTEWLPPAGIAPAELGFTDTLTAILTGSLPPGLHVDMLSGATMLGAFFIATDPVTAATSHSGRLIYGAGIGVLTYVIRTWGQYPDGVAFAVLLMNLAVPLIDKFTVPRIYGEPT